MVTREPLQSINDRNDRNLFFWTPMVAFTAVMAVLGVTEIHSLIDFNNHIAMYALGGLLIVLLNAGRTWSRRRAGRYGDTTLNRMSKQMDLPLLDEIVDDAGFRR